MIASRLKAWMPRSLYGRATLILLVPVITILLVVSVVFIQRLYENVTQQMTAGVAHEVRLVLDRIEAAPDASRAWQDALLVAAPLGIELSTASGQKTDRRGTFDLSGRVLTQTFRSEIPGLVSVDLMSRDRFVQLAIDTNKGPVLIELSRRRVSARNPHQFLVLIGITALLMTAIALIYLRNQMRPIRRLARAADAFGKGRVVPYRPSGASEVRQAGAAFLAMRDRIEHQIEQRTLMLSGVSHDLRTPLTRMKLGLGLMEQSEDVDAIRRDVDDMERMLDAFLDFARADAQEASETADLTTLAEEAVDRAKRGGMPVTLLSSENEANALVRPMSLSRALDNLIGNAVRYGDEAVVSVDAGKNHSSLVVEDRGPGIPEHLRETAMKPFSRLDKARNQDSGSGVGLGLSIAADIARRHGGQLILGKSEKYGGLRAEIRLPN